jgi:signal transduction histidine kinase
LSITTAFALRPGELSATPRLSVLALAALAGISYWAVVIQNPARRAHPKQMLAFVLLSLGFLTALASLHPIYLMAMGLFFGHVFRLLPLRWAIPPAVILAIAIAWKTAGYLGRGPAGFVLMTAFCALFLAFFIDSIVRQSLARHELVKALEATREELAAVARRAGAMEERQRLAAEIHDTLTQDLISIARLLEAEDSTSQDAIAQARRVAKEGVAQSRRLVWSLRPDLLSNDSLEGALRRVVERTSKEAGIDARLEVPVPCGALASEIEVTLLRSAQEALTNVRKHAQAKSVTVTLTKMDDRVALDVCDDGMGFDLSTLERDPSRGGFGLEAMRERVERLGGSFAVETLKGEGTTLAIDLPAQLATSTT